MINIVYYYKTPRYSIKFGALGNNHRQLSSMDHRITALWLEDDIQIPLVIRPVWISHKKKSKSPKLRGKGHAKLVKSYILKLFKIKFLKLV